MSGNQFAIGIAVGAIAAGGIVYISMIRSASNAEDRAHRIETAAEEARRAGSDERLQMLDPHSGGNGTIFLYDSLEGRLWMGTADGVRLLPVIDGKDGKAKEPTHGQ